MNKFGTNHEPRRLARLPCAAGLVCLALVLALSFTGGVSQATGSAAVAPDLGSAASFAVLGGQTVTNTGPSTVTGDLGVSPGTAITGFPPGIVLGATHAGDAVALQAQNDVTIAYNDLAGQACDTDLTGQDLGGLTLTEGVYCFSSLAQLTGQLTLDAQGNPDAVWIFQIVSGLNTASSASVLVTNGGGACNVFWQVGSSATLGTGNSFVGNILALTSISLATGTDVSGRALARNGAVTMDTNDISIEACDQVPPQPTPPPTPPPVVPEASTLILLGSGLAGVAGYVGLQFRARRRKE
jgi:hypothetical protein